jgi:exonuclease III
MSKNNLDFEQIYFNKYLTYKIKYLQFKQKYNYLDTPIKVMTWNVCWEALDGAKSRKLDKSECKIKGKNICLENIKKIIQEKIDESYDIICLQEIRKSQWKKLELIVPSHTVIFNDIERAGIITIINKKYKIKNKFVGNLIDYSIDLRPYTIVLLDNNLVLINVHFPHQNNLQIDAIQNLKSQIYRLSKYINSDTKFLMCGDFNNNDPTLLTGFNSLLPFSLKFISLENQINTCCVTNSHKSYTLSYDHIYSNLKNIKYETLGDDNLVLYDVFISDHLPLFAEFR